MRIPQDSIERALQELETNGDARIALVELMGGRVIEVDLEGTETLNPWDLPPGQISPSKEKIAFLKNLTLL